MFAKSYTMSKVKFQDQESEDYVLENSVLKSKLQSKLEALSIMSRELDKCSMERDRYKVLVEQLKVKHNISAINNDSQLYPYRLTKNKMISGGELLAFTREENKILKLEVESLRSKLEEATGDIEVLRKQLQLAESNCMETSTMETRSNKDLESLVQDLERTQKKYQQIKHDYQSVLDEKEELIADRDYYKNKVFRLNHQISLILTNRVKNKQQADEETPIPKPVIDIDAMAAENKYLQERITQLQLEKEIAKRNLSKYKSLLENRSKSSATNLKTGIIDVMTQKQVKEFLDWNLKTGLKRTSISELKSLCMGLFEALNDKSIALQHQRKTNQILANRITELEKTLESWCNGEKYIPIFPSQMLLDEFMSESEIPKKENNEKYTNNQIEDNSEVQKQLDYDTVEYCNDMTNAKDIASKYTEDQPRRLNKTILPLELEELVREALAELKPTE